MSSTKGLSGPLRAGLTEVNQHDEMEAEIRRSQVICSLRLKEKAMAAQAAVEKKGLAIIRMYHLLIGAYRADIADIGQKTKCMQALLPYARQLKVLRDGLQQMVHHKDDIQTAVQYLVTTTRETLSILPFHSGGLLLKEAKRVMKQGQVALMSSELDKLPLLTQALESYELLTQKLDRIVRNADQCHELIRHVKQLDSDDELYRNFVQKWIAPTNGCTESHQL